MPTSALSPAELLPALADLRAAVAEEGRVLLDRWHSAGMRRPFRLSAVNLAHYLALRHRDIRPLQAALMPHGLSSLGRLEGKVLPTLDAVIGALEVLAGGPPRSAAAVHPWRFERGDRLLRRAADELFGIIPAARARRERILVTLPTEAATTPDLLEALLAAGADCVRINCAHDGPDDWQGMIDNLRRAEERTGRSARVLMDLGGPKCRTGEVLFPPDTPRLRVGDCLRLVGTPTLPPDGDGFRATCTLPQAIDRLRPGDPIFYNDGKIGGVVESVGPDGAEVRITRAPGKGGKLKPDKGLNFPATALDLDPLTAEDRRNLAFVVRHADMIGYSFVQSAEDIVLLQRELADRAPETWRTIGLVAKIETPRAVRNLPRIIVQAASAQPFGVMIARGDLAVEIGFERLAEMQEEILWLCEAAHIPVIWATQVLESLVRTGLPTRGDMTDAAMAARAECVMLNKGPHVVDAIATLDRLLTRMAEHQTKKTPRLRALASW